MINLCMLHRMNFGFCHRNACDRDDDRGNLGRGGNRKISTKRIRIRETIYTIRWKEGSTRKNVEHVDGATKARPVNDINVTKLQAARSGDTEDEFTRNRNEDEQDTVHGLAAKTRARWKI